MKSQASGPAPVMVRYGGALLAVAAATVARFLLNPVLGSDFPFHTFWLAVAYIGYRWGAWPAGLASALGVLCARFFFVPPVHSLWIPDATFVFRMGVYLAYCAGIIGITVALRVAHDRADAARQRAEAAELRANRILDSISDGFAVFDSAWRFLRVNPRAEEITRKSRQEVLGCSIWELYPEMLGGPFYQALHRTSQERIQSHFEEYYAPLDLWVEGNSYPGEEGVTIFFREITARKKAELELAAQTKELRRKSELLENSNAELEQFAYAAAHDLQEPLRIVSGEAQHLLGMQNESEARQALLLIEHSAARMRNLIHDLLSYSWVVSKAEPDFSSADCQVLVDMAVMNCAAGIGESKAIVETGEMPHVRGNALQIVQVFQNLVSNAIKYRREDTPHIQIAAVPQDGAWVFSVRDNGMGLDMKYADRIFGVFKRLHGSEIPGTGIGLAICKRIIENHRGRIWVESKVGSGSTFFFTLPSAETE